MTEQEPPVEEPTNFKRLTDALPETGIARALLSAWTTGDPVSRVDRMVKVAQPPSITETNNDPSDN